MRSWLWSALVSIDQTCGVILSPVLFYRVQSPDETISSRIGKIKARAGGRVSWLYPLAKLIHLIVNTIDPGHFEKSIELDED